MASRDKIKKLLKGASGLARQIRKATNEAAPESPVTVEFGNQKIQVPAYTTLLEAAIQLQLDLDHFCGGNCSCGSCRIQVLQGGDNLSPPQPGEQIVLGPEAQGKGDRLACQARAAGPVSVGIPDFFMV